MENYLSSFFIILGFLFSVNNICLAEVSSEPNAGSELKVNGTSQSIGDGASVCPFCKDESPINANTTATPTACKKNDGTTNPNPNLPYCTDAGTTGQSKSDAGTGNNGN